jgi:thiosulfate/3-mercaptopyruvate sulfurtransferase
MRRRKFIAALGAAAVAWPHTAPTSQNAQAATGAVEPLVSASWLRARLGAKMPIVLDIRSAAAFAEGHIPGAVHSDYESGWRLTPGGTPPMLPRTAEFEALIGDAGIDADSRVVVVPAGTDSTEFGAAARVYWTLKLSGVGSVSILDGGFAAWRLTPDKAMESGPTETFPTLFTATIDKRLVADAGDVEIIERIGGATLVDARPYSFFAGREKVPAVAAYGHIPGALSLDSAAFYDANANRLRSRTELAKIASIVPEGPIVTYCNSGHWSATDWFVLSELLHRPDVKLYYGSMIEWTSDPWHRVETIR